MEIETPTVVGAIDKVWVTRTARQADLGYCLDTHGFGSENGLIVVKVVIASSGAVTEATLKSSTVDRPKFERCLLDEISTWIFPAPKDGGSTVVEYPFRFSIDYWNRRDRDDSVRHRGYSLNGTKSE